ncbi:oligosaccharide flippase family protein [Paenibacillus lacisoli]|uniref:oligosaccharide flippase family protein n=1 Tax=Paenibacillus lacisoli TaxID=3064525 RepID=UPI00272D905F|nr:oligosaccharide flippase family protein [Paenibacillus sp. JX-17]
MKQTLIRASAILIVKIIGLSGKIYLIRSVGMEGVGLYQLAYSFYGLVIMCITGGLPTALAMYSSHSPVKGQAILKKLGLFLMPLSLLISFITYSCAPRIAAWMGYPSLEVLLRILSPAIFLVPLLALLRGYLQGTQHYGSIALSEIIEQALRIGLLILLVGLCLPYGQIPALGGAAAGTFAGALGAFLLLLLYSRSILNTGQALIPSKTEGYSMRSDLAVLLQMSVTIALTRLLIPFSDFMDSLIIPYRLQAAGVSSTEAVEVLGMITGVALVVAYTPTLITGALSHTLTMQITSYWKSGLHQEFYKRSKQAVELAWIWGIASGCFIFSYHEEIARLVFNTPAAAPAIQALSALPLIVGVREITTSILWARDQKRIPFTGTVWGVALCIITLYVLVGVPGFSFMGIYLGFTILELVSVIWNIRALRPMRYIRSKLVILLVDLLYFEIISLFTVHILRSHTGQWPALVTSLCIYGLGTLIYLLFRIQRLIQRKTE